MSEEKVKVTGTKRKFPVHRNSVDEACKRWGYDWKKIEYMMSLPYYRYFEQVMCGRCIQKINAGITMLRNSKKDQCTQTDTDEDLSQLLPPDFEDILKELDELSE